MSEELGREFGWDDVIQNDGQEFEPIPEGDYDFVIDKFERKADHQEVQNFRRATWQSYISASTIREEK